MNPTKSPPDPRSDPDQEAAALAALEPFTKRLLPGMLRRLSAFSRLPAGGREDLIADLEQELRLDCLQHAAAILDLPPRGRHQHWFRLAARWLYRHRRHGELARADLDPPACGAAAPEPDLADLQRLMPEVPPRLLDGLYLCAERHGNGRYNLTATAGRLGMRTGRLRRLWARAAERLGYGDEFLAFWRLRLAEALTGLAADLLRDSGRLHLLPADRRRPDPRGRMRRIRRIHALLQARPVPPDLRQALAPLRRRCDPGRLAPAMLLVTAQRLAPESAAIPLWRFEAAVVDGDLRAAARALRAARALAADRVAVVLARARLLEARGCTARATALLQRAAARRHPRDARLRRALAACQGVRAADRGQRSAAASTRPSSSSPSRSGRGDDHVGSWSNQPNCR